MVLYRKKLETAIADTYVEVMASPDRTGFTVSRDVNWKEYDVGGYFHAYVKPNTIVPAAAVAVGAALWVTKGAAAPAVIAIFSK